MSAVVNKLQNLPRFGVGGYRLGRIRGVCTITVLFSWRYLKTTKDRMG